MISDAQIEMAALAVNAVLPLWMHRGAAQQDKQLDDCRLFARAALTAALSLPAQEGWQTMESAVIYDGVILLGWGEYRERDGFSPAFMRWYDTINGWSVNAMPFYPTHWRPLPAPPHSS